AGYRELGSALAWRRSGSTRGSQYAHTELVWALRVALGSSPREAGAVGRSKQRPTLKTKKAPALLRGLFAFIQSSSAEDGFLGHFEFAPADAGDEAPAFQRFERRADLGAARLGEAAARAEGAARGRIDGRGNFALQGIDIAQPCQFRIGDRNGRQQRAGI